MRQIKPPTQEETAAFNKYHHYSKAHTYCIGYVMDGYVRYIMAKKEDLALCIGFDTQSQTNKTLRFQPAKQTLQELEKKKGFENLCTTDEFRVALDKLRESTGKSYNRGQLFEKLIYNRYNQLWQHNSTPFFEKGDITINGVEIQIKYNKATFCSLKTLEELEKLEKAE